MLFTKCKKRYSSERTTRTEVEEILEEESEEEFEIISNHEEDQEVTQVQDAQREEVEEERPAEVVREEPVLPPPQEVVNEARMIYVTKSGEKYHLSHGCDTLRGYRSYERKVCERCRESAQRVLTIDPNRSPPQKETEITFVYGDEVYHRKDCERIRHTRRKGSRPICYVCEGEERMVLWNREAVRRGTGDN